MGATCCAAVENTEGKKNILIEYLYLDLSSCDRCVGTDTVLEEVLLEIDPALKLAGYKLRLEKVKMSTAELAQKYHFLSSPTIRVNGHDVCTSVMENSCGCCSEISGTAVDCRVFVYEGKQYEVPPKQMIAESILKSVFADSGEACGAESYVLPENLKIFYEGKSKKETCGCGCSSC